MDPLRLLILGFVALIVLFVFLYYFPIGLWMKVRREGVNVSMFDLARIRMVGLTPEGIVNDLIMARKAGVEVDIAQVTAQRLSGGHPDRVIIALARAKQDGVQLTWVHACAVDLASGNALGAERSPTGTF